MRRRTAIALTCLLTLIALAHVGLWRSDRVPDEVKLRLTLINALGWGIVLLPAWGVSRWLRARQRRDP